MLSVKLVRSLVLGETITNPFHSHENPPSIHTHVNYDGDNDDDDDDDHTHIHNKIKKKRMPFLLFIPTKELICDTFRLATIARDIGMDFHPTPSLSHLLFSWPSSTPSSSSCPSLSSLNAPFTPSPSNYNNHRISVSSTSTYTSTLTLASSSSSTSALQSNDAVPIPFPSLTTTSSLSLLRYFVSLSKGLFKLVFLHLNPNPDSNSNNNYCNYGYYNYNYDCSSNLSLFSRVSGRKVKSMDDLSRDLAGKGWALFRTPEKRKLSSLSPSSSVSLSDSVYLFRKMDSGRVRVGNNGGGGGECRVRELRLPALDFEKGVNYRVLLYLLLMTDDIFYLD